MPARTNANRPGRDLVMGYQLRRQLREALGPDVTGLQRLVALEIADDANDHTRVSRASLDDLARWTGAKNAKAVRDMLTRLGAAGWEFRVPISKGADGRPVYATRGHTLTFRVPEFEVCAESEGPTTVGPSRREGPTVVGPNTGKGLPPSPKGPTAVGPLSSGSPQRTSLSLADRLRAAGVSEAEEREIIEWISKNRPDVRSPRGYLRTVAGNGDLADLLAEWHQAARAKTSVSVLPEWCGRCGLDTQPLPDGRPAAALNARLRFVGSVGAGGEPCPECHPACVAAS